MRRSASTHATSGFACTSSSASRPVAREQHGAASAKHAAQGVQVRPIVIHTDDDRLASLVEYRLFQIRNCQCGTSIGRLAVRL